MKFRRCKICKKKAKYYEWSPDGASDFFCSEKHHIKYKKIMWKKGLVWRASPLKEITEQYQID